MLEGFEVGECTGFYAAVMENVKVVSSSCKAAAGSGSVVLEVGDKYRFLPAQLCCLRVGTISRTESSQRA